MEVFYLSIVLMGFVTFLLAIRIIISKVFFNKQVKFVNTSIGSNPNMKKLGISCAKHDEMKCYSRSKKGLENKAVGSSCGCG
jgi:hypothetical protein